MKLSNAQLALHWRLWSQVAKKLGFKGNSEQMDAHRHGIYAEALGNPKSLTDFTNSDLDRVLGRFRVIISDYTNVAAQVQVDNPDLGEVKRRLHVIKHIQPRLLALYVQEPLAYMEQIMRDRFGITDQVRPLEDLHLHELDMLRATVARAIDKLRQQHNRLVADGQPGSALDPRLSTVTITVHEMYQAARLTCPPATGCRKCALARVATHKLNHTQPAHA